MERGRVLPVGRASLLFVTEKSRRVMDEEYLFRANQSFMIQTGGDKGPKENSSTTNRRK